MRGVIRARPCVDRLATHRPRRMRPCRVARSARRRVRRPIDRPPSDRDADRSTRPRGGQRRCAGQPAASALRRRAAALERPMPFPSDDTDLEAPPPGRRCAASTPPRSSSIRRQDVFDRARTRASWPACEALGKSSRRRQRSRPASSPTRPGRRRAIVRIKAPTRRTPGRCCSAEVARRRPPSPRPSVGGKAVVLPTTPTQVRRTCTSSGDGAVHHRPPRRPGPCRTTSRS